MGSKQAEQPEILEVAIFGDYTAGSEYWKCSRIWHGIMQALTQQTQYFARFIKTNFRK